MSKPKTFDLIKEADDIINDIIDSIDTLPISAQEFLGWELSERIRRYFEKRNKTV